MKNLIFTFFTFFTFFQYASAQDVWSEKANYGGGVVNSSSSFTINGKGYIGMGFDNDTGEGVNSFWQYDPLTDTWTQMADVTASPRGYTIGFSIGDRGYIGGGFDGVNVLSDFYEYNEENNSWSQKGDIPGTARIGGSIFTINGRGYVGLGYDLNADTDLSDFLSYNPMNDTWTPVADFAGPKRQGAASFSVGGSGYICSGYDNENDLDFKDMWAYDVESNTWSQKTDLAGQQREFATGFEINGKGYITCGYNYDDNILLNDLWEYDALNDSWSQKDDLPGPARQSASAFTVSGKGYVVTGINFDAPLNDVWEYGVPAANQPPVADAGTDIEITLPVNSITLDGSGTDSDGSIVSYEWSQDINNPSSASISDPTIADPELSGLIEGTYTFILTVTDDDGDTDSDEVQVTVNPAPNVAPVADAGLDIYVPLPLNTTTLDGSGTDVDGTIASFTWVQVGDQPSVANISDASIANPGISDLVEGVYEFELTVTDDEGATDTDTVTVEVGPEINLPPVADAGDDITLVLPQTSTTLDGSGTDPEGIPVTFLWEQVGTTPSEATISDVTIPNPEVSDLVIGTYTFRLSVTDDNGQLVSDEVTIFVNDSVNHSPLADAGSDLAIILPLDSVQLSGSGIDDDGTIVSYLWEQVGTQPSIATISDTAITNPVINNLVLGTYTFRLTVTDDDGATAIDEVNVFVTDTINEAPVALAGIDLVVIYPIDTAQLNGSGTDVDGTIVSYEWSQVDDVPSIATISDPNIADPVIGSLSVEGIYTFRLTVTDNEGMTGSDIVQIYVYDSINNAPVAFAGSNEPVIFPVDTFAANGSGSDVDGTIVVYHWAQIGDLPSVVTISDTAIANPVIGGLNIEGTYEFVFTVTDDDGAFASDTLQIFVYDSINNLPTADAGPDKTITLPVNSSTLNGTGSDEDGTIEGYSWEQVGEEPALASIFNNSIPNTEVSNLIEGVYTFVLTVTDNSGGTATDTMHITVLDTTNNLPVALAGDDITITLPQDSVDLDGSGTDSDGTIASYAWDQVGDEPSIAIFSDSTVANPEVSGLIEGTYTFVLTVTDNEGATATDTMLVVVNPAPNVAPTADAGDDITLLSMTNTTLDGSGSDVDGEIISYLWAQVGTMPSIATISDIQISNPQISNLVLGTYTFVLTVTDNDGATDTDTVLVIVDMEVSTGQVDMKLISVYPNPAPNGRMIIDCGSQVKVGTKALIMNSAGKTIERFTVNSEKHQLELSAFPAGVYFLQFENGIRTKVVIMD